MSDSKPKKKAGKRSKTSPPTWWASHGCFRKRLTIDGKLREFYFKYPNTKKGQEKAAADWLVKLADLKHAAEVARCVAYHLKQADRADTHQDYRDTMLQIARDLESGRTYDEAQERAINAMAMRLRMREGKFAEASQLGSVLEPRRQEGMPMSGLLEEYCTATERRRKSGEIGKSRNYAIQRWARSEMTSEFGNAVIPETEEQFGILINDYRDRCLDEMEDGDYNEPGFDDRMKECKQFISWAVSKFKLPHEPRNFKVAFKKFNSKPKSAKMIPLDDLSKLWEKADGKMKTIIAISLNCGFTSVDYAHVTPGMVQDGRLNFTRHKTQKQTKDGRGVNVSYPLWEVTLKLIREYANASGNYLMTDDNGNPLHIELDRGRDDKLYLAFKALCSDAGVTGYTFSYLRDTGTTLIEEIDNSFSDAYAAHMDRRIAAFYIDGKSIDKTRLYRKFDKAMDRLGKRLADVLV